MAPLSDTLKALGLHHTAAHLDDLVALATKRRWSPVQLLEHLVATEQQERTRRSLERRLTRARIGRFTPMTDFDWAWPTRIDRATVEAALRLDFLTEARNLVLVAPQGLGQNDDRAESRSPSRARRTSRPLPHRRAHAARPRRTGLRTQLGPPPPVLQSTGTPAH